MTVTPGLRGAHRKPPAPPADWQGNITAQTLQLPQHPRWHGNVSFAPPDNGGRTDHWGGKLERARALWHGLGLGVSLGHGVGGGEGEGAGFAESSQQQQGLGAPLLSVFYVETTGWVRAFVVTPTHTHSSLLHARVITALTPLPSPPILLSLDLCVPK